MIQEAHSMEHVGTDEHGVDEFYCKTCGYHFKISWPPSYHRIIISEAGDPYAIHRANTAIPGLEMDMDADILEIDPYLAPFEKFIDKVDFNDPVDSGE